MSTLEITTVNPSEYGIAENQATELVGNLPQIKSERDILSVQYDEVVRLDIEDAATSKKARELRLKIRDNRTKGIDVWHRTTKDFFLKGGQFVDAIKRQEVAVNERMEKNLENIEKHFENLEKERKAQLNAERISELEPFNAFVPMGLNFGDLSDDEYTKVLNGAKLQFEHQQEEERKAEAERQKFAEIQKLHNNRKESLLPVWQFVENKDVNFGEMTDAEFSTIKENADSKKIEFDAEQEKIKAENERLKQLEIDRILKLEQNAEKHIKTLVEAGFEISNNDSYMDNLQHRYGKGNYSVSVGNLQNMTTEEVSSAITNVNNWIAENERLEAEKKALEGKAAKEKADAEKKLAKERSDQAAKLKAEQDAKAKIEAELQAKKDAEAKAETERLAEEKRLKEEAEALAKAPIKDQLNVWVTSFELPSANIDNEKADLIKAKFEAFKRWAFAEIELM